MTTVGFAGQGAFLVATPLIAKEQTGSLSASGIVFGAAAVGGLLATLWIVKRPLRQTDRTLVVTTWGVGIAMVVMGVAPVFWLVVVAAFALGAFDGPQVAAMEAETMERTEGDLQRLAAAYDRKHVLITEDDGSVTLAVGEKGWEFPAPLICEHGVWRFDTAAGAMELTQRRIEANEAEAVAFMLDCIGAQRAFKNLSAARGADRETYADRFVSTPGLRDGLYWDDSLGAPRSPLGPVAAAAFAQSALPCGPC
jgi:hypothetical protein